MNFSAWSIRNPIAPILGLILILLLGWQSFNRLPITRFPGEPAYPKDRGCRRRDQWRQEHPLGDQR
jgi:hypothetical protein